MVFFLSDWSSQSSYRLVKPAVATASLPPCARSLYLPNENGCSLPSWFASTAAVAARGSAKATST
jgi:hypothetical protein